jgi:hypothetical protein
MQESVPAQIAELRTRETTPKVPKADRSVSILRIRPGAKRRRYSFRARWKPSYRTDVPFPACPDLDTLLAVCLDPTTFQPGTRLV